MIPGGNFFTNLFHWPLWSANGKSVTSAIPRFPNYNIIWKIKQLKIWLFICWEFESVGSIQLVLIFSVLRSILVQHFSIIRERLVARAQRCQYRVFFYQILLKDGAFLRKILKTRLCKAENILEYARVCPALHRIALVSHCRQRLRSEAYVLNMLMRCVDSIQWLSVHQSEHYFACNQYG